MADYLSKYTGSEIDNSVGKTAELDTKVTTLDSRVTELEQGGTSGKRYYYTFRIISSDDIRDETTAWADIYFTLSSSRCLYERCEDVGIYTINQPYSVSQFLDFINKSLYKNNEGSYNQVTIYDIKGFIDHYKVTSVGSTFYETTPLYITVNDTSISLNYRYSSYSLTVQSGEVGSYNTVRIDNYQSFLTRRNIFEDDSYNINNELSLVQVVTTEI